MPLALAVMCGGLAEATPVHFSGAQPGTTGPTQPGATQPAQPGATMGAQPGVTVAAPNSAAVQQDQAAPTTDYGTQRSVPAPRYAAPVDPGRLHAPVPVAPVAPIAPPPNTIRIGQFESPSPDWLPGNVRDGVNGAAANTEAQVSTFARSVGVAPNRSDRIAGTAGLGALAGAALGFVPLGLPGIVVGGVIGGTIGGVAAAVIAIPYFFMVPLVAGQIAGGVALGAAAGALVGGAVTGLVPGVIGAVAGGVLGAAIGSGT